MVNLWSYVDRFGNGVMCKWWCSGHYAEFKSDFIAITSVRCAKHETIMKYVCLAVQCCIVLCLRLIVSMAINFEGPLVNFNTMEKEYVFRDSGAWKYEN